MIDCRRCGTWAEYRWACTDPKCTRGKAVDNVVKFRNGSTLEEALEVVDALRQALVDGKVISFSAAAISEKDELFAYIGSAVPVSRLRMSGAMSHMCTIFEQGGWDND